MFYIQVPNGRSLRLDQCTGRRYEEGEYLPCNAGCAAHFDVNAETEYGVFASPYPNTVLSWIDLVPGTSREAVQVTGNSENGTTPEWVQVYRNGTVFHGADGEAADAWIVVVHADDPDRHFAAVFHDRHGATGLVDELITPEQELSQLPRCPG